MELPTDPQPGTSAATDRLITFPFVLITLCTLCYFTGLGTLLTTLPKYIKDDLGGNGFSVGLSVGIFSVAAAVLRPWAGQLGDRKGRRILVVGGCLIVAFSVAAYDLADNLALLIGLRIISGIGEAAVFVGAATAVQDLAPAHRRGEAASYFSVALYAGLALGPPLGEYVADAHGYKTTWIVAGSLAFAAALFGLRTPIGVTSNHRPETILNRAALKPGVVLFLGLMPFTAFSAFLALYGEKIGIDSVGPIFAVYAGGVLLIRVFGARLPDQLGWRIASVVALGTATAAGLTFAVWTDKIGIYVAALALSIGQSLLFPALFSAVINDAPDEERSHAVGTFSVFFDLSGGVGAPLLGLVVSLSSYRGAFITAAGLSALGFVALQTLKASEDRRVPSLASD
ncbi:MAG: MFS transporter [Ilumatobacteraceae bacterium]